MLELFGLTQVLHSLFNLSLLEFEGLVTRVDLDFEVLNIFYELQNLLILVLHVNVQFHNHVLEPMLFID